MCVCTTFIDCPHVISIICGSYALITLPLSCDVKASTSHTRRMKQISLQVWLYPPLSLLRVLCALTNAIIPETFPTEVLVNDRYTGSYICTHCKNLHVYIARPPKIITYITHCTYIYMYMYLDALQPLRMYVYTSRWTINLALETFSKFVCVKSAIDSEDMRKVILESVE